MNSRGQRGSPMIPRRNRPWSAPRPRGEATDAWSVPCSEKPLVSAPKTIVAAARRLSGGLSARGCMRPAADGSGRNKRRRNGEEAVAESRPRGCYHRIISAPNGGGRDFAILRHRLEEAVSRSSCLVDDIKRLMKARALAVESAIQTHQAEDLIGLDGTEGKRQGVIEKATTPPLTLPLASRVGACSVPDRSASPDMSLGAAPLETDWFSSADHFISNLRSRPPARLNSPARLRDDVERLRRAVREVFPLSSSNSRGGSRARIARSGHEPQWSQQHEACLGDMRNSLRKTGSPLLAAKDPAVLVGALLRRQGPLLHHLDGAVTALKEQAGALNALVSVAHDLKNAGYSADTLFTRAGIVGSEEGRTGATSPSFSGRTSYIRLRRDGRPARMTTTTTRRRRRTRRCTVKQLHLELQRVFGEERVSMRELKVALSACLSGGNRKAGWKGDGDEKKGGTKKALALDWVSVDQLDAALTNCHVARRALDPQGACHPPMTGKRAAEFLDTMNRLQTCSAARGAVQRAMTSVAEPHLEDNGTRWGRRGGKVNRRKRDKATAVVAVRKRAAKWTEDERDLAERELAAAIVERQQASVEGYVQQRRRYLNRRVTAQRVGHGGFIRERVEVEVRPCGMVTRSKPTEAAGGDFADALKRTKIRLKALEAKASTPAGHAVAVWPSTRHESRGVSPLRGAIARRRNPRQGDADHQARKESTTAVLIRSSPTHGGTGASTTRGAPAPKADLSRLLRSLTETYSDRIQERGGGIASCSSPNSKAPRSSAWDGGQGEATMYAERSRLNAAAFTLQQAFRRRMFHRFIWAQAYLRRPTHAFRIFKRVCEPLPGQPPGYGHPVDMKQPLPTNTSSHGHLDDEHAAEMIVSMDEWPEPPGFHVSAPRHEHAADAAFRNYRRWCRRRTEKNDAGRDASSGTYHGAEVPREAGCRSPQWSASPEPSRGAELFERKHPIHREVLRTLFLDLRITVSPAEMDFAIRDLDTALLGDDPSMAEGGSKSGRIGHPMSRDRHPSHPKETSPLRHGLTRKLDFATFYGWWVRHLPYDPTSAGSILKTVRCARALHAAEIAERAARASRA